MTTQSIQDLAVILTDQGIAEGDTVYLIEAVGNDDGYTTRTYWLSAESPRTNLGHEVQLHGWLGTTNNIAEYAHGAWRLASLTEHGDGCHADLVQLADDGE